MTELVFTDLVALDDAQRERVRVIYEEAFPEWERGPFDQLVAAARRGERHDLVALDAGLPVAFAALARLQEVDCMYLEYLAVADDRRGQSLGTTMWGQLLAVLADRDEPLRLVFEVEHPEADGIAPTEAELRRRRIHFYERLGAAPLPYPGYLVPNLVDGGTEPMQLMYADCSPAPQPRPRGEAVRQLVLALYAAGYDLAKDHPLVVRAREASTEGVEVGHGSL